VTSCCECDNGASKSVVGREFSDQFSVQLLAYDNIKLVTNTYKSFETSRFFEAGLPTSFSLGG